MCEYGAWLPDGLDPFVRSNDVVIGLAEVDDAREGFRAALDHHDRIKASMRATDRELLPKTISEYQGDSANARLWLARVAIGLGRDLKDISDDAIVIWETEREGQNIWVRYIFSEV